MDVFHGFKKGQNNIALPGGLGPRCWATEPCRGSPDVLVKVRCDVGDDATHTSAPFQVFAHRRLTLGILFRKQLRPHVCQSDDGANVTCPDGCHQIGSLSLHFDSFCLERFNDPCIFEPAALQVFGPVSHSRNVFARLNR